MSVMCLKQMIVYETLMIVFETDDCVVLETDGCIWNANDYV
jgi:hypothetical protein